MSEQEFDQLPQPPTSCNRPQSMPLPAVDVDHTITHLPLPSSAPIVEASVSQRRELFDYDYNLPFGFTRPKIVEAQQDMTDVAMWRQESMDQIEAEDHRQALVAQITDWLRAHNLLETVCNNGTEPGYSDRVRKALAADATKLNRTSIEMVRKICQSLVKHCSAMPNDRNYVATTDAVVRYTRRPIEARWRPYNPAPERYKAILQLPQTFEQDTQAATGEQPPVKEPLRRRLQRGGGELMAMLGRQATNRDAKDELPVSNEPVDYIAKIKEYVALTKLFQVMPIEDITGCAEDAGIKPEELQDSICIASAQLSTLISTVM